MKQKTFPLASRQRGVSLLEVLVAVLILSFGLLGMASLQMTTLRNNQSSFERSRAIMAVYSITDSLRADIKDQGALDTNAGFAKTKIGTWQQEIKNQLGGDAVGNIVCTPATVTPLSSSAITTHTCRVTITWDDSRGLNGGAQTMTTEVQL
ncbi:type IV pilus modification protein PilV [Azonexus sp.]|uniref:type IV pilus modification protein PilV n=1 Tax=Azonexus sp. TaxID=1872668 RepID=UPI0039E5A700